MNDTKSPANFMAGAFMIIGAAVLWGTSGTTQALAPEGATPMVVAALRQGIGALTLIAFALSRGKGAQIIKLPPVTTILTGLFAFGYHLSFFKAATLTGVGLASIISVGIAPAVAGLLSFLMQKEKPLKNWYLCTLLAVGGAAILISQGGTLYVNTTGVLFALVAGVAYATFTVLLSMLIRNHDADAAVGGSYAVGALVAIPVLIMGDTAWITASATGMAVALYLGVVITGGAYILYGNGLRSVTAPTAVTLALAEPLTAFVLGVVVLGEKLGTTSIVGVALLFGALAALTLGHSKRAKS
jgi:DME family drug/metabolite transporter